MSTKWGIHVPNKDACNLDRMWAMFGPDEANITMLHHNLGEGYVEHMVKHHPGGIIHVRFYLPTWSAVDPATWAQECANIAQYWGEAYGWERFHWSPANEQNLDHEGGGDSHEWYQRIAAWNATWAQVFLARHPGAIVQWPGLAPGHNDIEFGYEICRPVIEEWYPIIGMHVYWFNADQVDSIWYGRRYQHVLDLFPNHKVAISECGNFRHDTGVERGRQFVRFFEGLYEDPRLLYATPFIWASGPEHRCNWWFDDTECVRVVTEAPKQHIQEPNAIRIWRRDIHDGVQVMHLERYLYGVVCSEMYCGWPSDALKAQAVAARTYAMHWRLRGGKHRAQGADLCTETCCQVYRPANITPRSTMAVEETRGIHLVDASGGVIQAEYCACCGGSIPGCPCNKPKNGHGRGMCQEGAKVFAERGTPWQAILKFYYPMAHLSSEDGGNMMTDEEVGEELIGYCDDFLLADLADGWEWNPYTAFTRAARQHRLGLPITKEHHHLLLSDGRQCAAQWFWRGMTWAFEGEWGNIHIVEY